MDELIKKIRRCTTDPMHCLSCGEVKDGRCFKRLMTQAADAIEQLSNAGSAYGRGWTLGYDAAREEKQPRWIPVSERLPEDRHDVLVYAGVLFPYITVGYYDGLWKFSYNDEEIAGSADYWMPLPEPPKEE